jgi:hypothetical protein
MRLCLLRFLDLAKELDQMAAKLRLPAARSA